jgi:Pyridoxamine 5'-phosphate oxidase
MDAKNLADLYNLPTLDWAPIEAQLEKGFAQAPDTGGPNRYSYWLATVNADGSPHMTALGVIWADGAFWFTTGESSRKGRNVARDSRCALSVSAHDFDLTVEGEAHRVTDPEVVAARAKTWAEDWPCEVDDSGIALTAPFSAPSAGPPPWAVYKITVKRATALWTVEPGGATRWTF